MKCDKKHMKLYAVTDRAWLGDDTLKNQVKQALEGGVTCVQLREKELCDEAFLAEALEIKALCQKYNVPFIINDNVEIAIKCGADGVHVGQHDMSAASVRKMIGENMILGVSVQTPGQATAAVENGADYLGVGAVFSTSTKSDADNVTYDTLKSICSAVSVPVVAIGGISEENITQLRGSGIDGVALVSAIFAADSITKACKKLYRLAEDITDNEN